MTTDARCGTGGIDALVNRMVLNPLEGNAEQDFSL